MVLNYYRTNYSGWLSPAFYYATKLQKIFETTKYFCYYFVNIFPNNYLLIYINNTAHFPLFFTMHPNNFSPASQKVLRSLAAKSPNARASGLQSVHCLHLFLTSIDAESTTV